MLRDIIQKIKHTKPSRKYLVVLPDNMHINFKNRRFYSSLIAGVILISILLPSLASAQTVRGTVACLWDGILDCTIYFIKDSIIKLIAFIGSGIDYAIQTPIAGVPVVLQSWELVRGFANMFFILVLIIMAFSTIFSIFPQYNFSSLIVRFLIAVLLINFSLVIGEIIINWSASLSEVFLQAIGPVGDRLGQGMDLSKRFDTGGVSAINQSVDLKGWNATVAATLDIVMLSIILFSLAVLMFFSMIRVPILWALLIISPIAWVTYILPSTRDINRRWWKQFIGWNVFMPIYLFFIYFGVLFLTNKNKVLNSTASLSGFNATFQEVFFYMLIGIFLIGGAKVAMGASMAAGAGGVAAGIWAKGRTTARFARSNVPFVSRYGRALGSGVTGRIQQLQKEGIQTRGLGWMYGGAEGEERTKAYVAQKFGVRDAQDKQLAKDVELTKGRQFNRMDVGDLEKYVANNKGKVPQREYVAALETLKEKRGLNGQQYLDLYNEYGGEKSENARKLLERIDVKSLDRDSRKLLDEKISNVKFKQKVADVRAETKDFENLEDWKRTLSLFTFEGDRVDFIKKSKDYLEFQGKKDRLKLFDGLQTGENKLDKGSLRELAMTMAGKGDFDLDSGKNLVGSGGIFETDTDKYRLLEAIEKKQILTALRLKEKAVGSDGKSLLRDPKGDVIDFQTALQAKVGRVSNEEILDQSKDEIKDLIDALLIDPNTGQETEATRRSTASLFTPARVKALTLSPKATNDKIAAMNKVFEIGKKEGTIKDKVKPLEITFDSIAKKCAEAMAIPTDIANRSKYDFTIDRINKLFGSADKRLKGLTGLGPEFIDDQTIQSLQSLYKNTQGLINQVKNKHK